MLERSEVKKVLNCPSKYLLELALEMVNLKDKERKAIELVDIKGNTEEKASETLKISRNSIQNYRKTAYNKFSRVWENQALIEEILNF